jgi:hypothetical protein
MELDKMIESEQKDNIENFTEQTKAAESEPSVM